MMGRLWGTSVHRDIEAPPRRAATRVGRRVIAVIGIDRYVEWPRLENAVRDALGSVSVKTGCVIPVDAARPRGHVSASWLRLDGWLSDIARLPPRHILVIV